jgi:hypothetical protein
VFGYLVLYLDVLGCVFGLDKEIVYLFDGLSFHVGGVWEVDNGLLFVVDHGVSQILNNVRVL